MKDLIGIVVLAAVMTVFSALCSTRPLGADQAPPCPTTTTESFYRNGKLVVCTVFVDCQGNVTRSCS